MSIKKTFLYLKYYFEISDKQLRGLAYTAAKNYYNKIPLRSKANPNPSVIEYEQRRNEFLRYQRAFIATYRHQYATNKLNQLN
jgi:hypothetical protein